jgi:hypothetical protein
MMHSQVRLIGILGLAAGFAISGFTLASTAGPRAAVEAGINCQPPIPTSTPVPPTATPILKLLGNGPTCTPVPQSTIGVINTRTPTPAASATSTVQPAATPTVPPPPPTATVPGSGVGAGGIQPPNTGSGPSGGAGGTSIWFGVLGAALAALGAVAVGTGLRRR